MTFSLHGIGVSRGVAIGKAHIIVRTQLEIDDYPVAPEDAPREIERLRDAVRQAKADLREVRKQIPRTTAADIAAFIDTHLLMLEDSALTFDAERLIREQGCNAGWALKQQRDALVRAFDAMDDPYLRTRKDDVDHVVSRIQRALLNHAPLRHEAADSRLRGMVIIADDLTPADTVLMQRNGVAAFVTESGGPTSHMSILARSLGIPGVVAVHGVQRYIKENEVVVIDGDAGVVVGAPDQPVLGHYETRRSDYARQVARLEASRSDEAITLDGTPVALYANVELSCDFDAARAVGADGVGLYRTEFLFMNRPDEPDEEEHFATYRQLIDTLNGMPVTIRTLDLGADKDFQVRWAGPPAANPALGLRAIRLSLHEPSLYWPQLRAIVRASAFGPVRLMIPMLSNVEEARQVVSNVRSVQQDFAAQGTAYDPEMPIGGMIEVPAAAICADSFARYLDFFSIGTNDLIQYTIAIDRVNEAVSYLYDPLNPAVLRLIAQTIDAGKAAGIAVGMCGEMAGDSRYTRLLLGLGLREFSVHPSLLLEIKHIIKNTSIDAIARLARRTLAAQEPEALQTLFKKLA
ncbi:MAG: phosphoenolpyruvate--protein phosphotransferase [Gammaproteobacteria bacterium]